MKEKHTSGKVYLLRYLSSQIDTKMSLGHYGTAANYRSTYLSIRTFTQGKDIPMSSVTVQWVNGYSSFLFSRGLVRNTVSFYMRVLRAIYNRALCEQPFRTLGNPFREVYTGVDKTVKRSVRLKDIARISTAGDSAGAGRKGSSTSVARDLFMFSFFSRGMCFVDMANLKWSDVSGGRIRYVRRKTGQKMELRIEPCMKALMEKYRNGSEFVFPILHSQDPATCYRQYRGGLCRFNAALKPIGETAGLSAPLTSYCSRHSWATACRDSGVSVSAISSALGHTSETTTQIYLASIDGDIIDRANRRLIERVSKMAKGSL